MGILKKGHLIETDRSRAGGGVRRADGAADECQDQRGARRRAVHRRGVQPGGAGGCRIAYGDEAVQALLKRAEDDRARLVVILAGYPDEMDDLLEEQPGLVVAVQSRARVRRLFAAGAGADFRVSVREESLQAGGGDAGEADARRDGAAPAARQAFRQRPGGAESVRARGAADGEPHRRHRASSTRSN